MTKTTKYIAHLDVTAPFGYKHDRNGLDFSKSIHNPDSNLARVINYLRACDVPVTRKNILFSVFGVHNNRSWGTLLFSLMVKTGMIEKYYGGNAVRYAEGRNAHKVTRVKSMVKGRIISDAR